MSLCHCCRFTLAEDCHLDSLISQCSFNLTGADFYALCTDAVLNAIKTKISLLESGEVEVDETLEVTEEDFSSALRCLVPSVSELELQNYKKLQCSLATPMSKTL
ncbi:hypothetical protein NP493_6449g00004 [Ridgeia piscesae]|uniref:AAA ATPase AAA+ lid domain-containing protein n=1 Tax=Ridgeia piscesae TaxID=27915 RepID=A0AAD9IR34_RIDPI|nr:hypothetical protein NP493_6449g00004 [Ridgeia piscesae]